MVLEEPDFGTWSKQNGPGYQQMIILEEELKLIALKALAERSCLRIRSSTHKFCPGHIKRGESRLKGESRDS